MIDTNNNNEMAVERRRNEDFKRDEDRTRGSSSSSTPNTKYDDPPNSRLFIVCGKQIDEDQFKEAFGVYGKIEEVWLLKDRHTKVPKGIAYIKFSKTSEAATAMEEMNGRCIAGCPRPLKVLIAHARDQGSKRELNEEERLLRLFVVVPKSTKESELEEHFAQFGDVDYVSIVKDRNTKENKGFAYIKYHRMSHAAKAFEDCERSYKPVFADPKPKQGEYKGHTDINRNHAGGSHMHGGGHEPGGGRSLSSNERGYRQGGGGGGGGPGSTTSGSTNASISCDPYTSLQEHNTSGDVGGDCRVVANVSSSIVYDLVWRLFDLVPGLEHCERVGTSSGDSKNNKLTSYQILYNNSQSATYAKDKLNGFEYPPGQKVSVMMVGNMMTGRYRQQAVSSVAYPGTISLPPPPPLPIPTPNSTASFINAMHGPISSVSTTPAINRGVLNAAQNAAANAQAQLQSAANVRSLQNDHLVANLTETIANATALLQASGYSAPGPPTTVYPTTSTTHPVLPHRVEPGIVSQSPISAVAQSPNDMGIIYDPSYCSVKLPAPHPLAPIDSPVAERLFIVCTPIPPPLYALKDVFGRFGNLIDIYVLNNKTCGYAKYAAIESAEAAVKSLHGQDVCGSRLKVMLADPQQDKNSTGGGDAGGRKRAKFET